MPRWAVSSPTRVWRATLALGLRNITHKRLFSSVEHIILPCASAGSITLSLHNIPEHHPSHPLIIWIPPFPQDPDIKSAASLPSWLQRFPAVIINYRWSGLWPEDPPDQTDVSDQAAPPSPLYWPAPIHDVLFGYSWIQKHLAPYIPATRDIYVCSSYLGASLAAGLALTESHDRQPTAVRGLINFNGIYNWTTFLPDHPINKSRNGPLPVDFFTPEEPADDSLLPLLKHAAPALFHTPDNLFDPFASACLFFHSAGLLVPPDFDTPLQPSELTQAINTLSAMSAPPSSDSSFPPITPLVAKQPRKGYLAFPPRNSTLKLPQTLLLHETTPPSLLFRRKRGGKRKSASGAGGGGENSFQTQANELASLMRRSVNLFELGRRVKWATKRGEEAVEEDDVEGSDEAEMRVQVGDVGRLDSDALDRGFGPGEVDGKEWMDGSKRDGDGEDCGADFGLPELGREMVGEWLEERI